MQVFRGGELVIPDPSPLLKEKVETACTIPNPLWYRLQRMGNTRALYGTPQNFTFSKTLPDGLHCPIGLLPSIKKFAGFYDIDLTITRLGPILKGKTYPSTFVPREEQQGVAEEIAKHTEGTVVLPTGFGKSLIALEVANILAQPTTILVPRIDLKRQFLEHLERLFPNKLHRPDVQVFTFQSLYRDVERLQEVALRTATLIVDECHMAISPKMLSVLKAFQPTNIYGFTATPDRTDGLGPAIHLFFGPTILERKSTAPPPSVHIIEFKGHIPMGEYSSIIEYQTEFQQRNELVAKLVSELHPSRCPIVLTKRVDHALTLSIMLPGSQVISSELSAKQREELFNGFKIQKKKPILIGTFSLLSTGIDVPFLDTLVIAGDLKSSVLQRQSAGRILRILSGKMPPLIIDIHDTNNPILHHQFRERKKLYDKLVWNISIGDSSGTLKS